MTTFHLIRHAERSGPPRLLAGRQPGFPLTPAGHAQAERLARSLAREAIHRIFSSPLERARETAGPLARLRSLAVGIEPAIGEIDFGEWTGRTFDELDHDPRWAAFNRHRATAQVPGGESLAGVQERFVSAMHRWRREFPETGIAIVSHADPIKAALAHFLGVPLELFDRIEIALGSVSVVEIGARHVRVVRLNETVSALAA